MIDQNIFRKLPVFITSMSRWDGDVSSASLSLAKVLSRENEVYYIDFPYSLADVWRERKSETVKSRMKALLWGKNFMRKVTGYPEKFTAVTPKAVIPNYSMAEGSLYEWTSDINNRILAGIIRKICKKNGIKDYILINSFNPLYLSEVNRYLEPTLSVYHSRDAIEEVPGHGLRKENICIKNYDLVMATSKQLCRKIGERNERFINYFPNGGDVKLFRTTVNESLAKPRELEDIKTPIIGYTGALCQRIDYELLVKILEENKDKTVVMVGPRKDKEFTKINLDQYPNIRFTGPKRIEELPSYLKYFDCAIIPFRKNNLTGGIYPLKINEYLAAGRSVVSTDFSEDINQFGKHIKLAATHEDFLKAIPEAISAKDEKLEGRYLASQENSWENRLELFWNLAFNTYSEKKSV